MEGTAPLAIQRLLRSYGIRWRGAVAAAMTSFLFAANAASPVSHPVAAPAPPSISALALEVDHADAQAQRIAVGAHLRSVDDAGLQSRLNAIPAIENELEDALAALDPRLRSADARLAELGPPPAPGQPAEDSEIAQERENILKVRRAVDTEIKQAHLVGIEVKQLETYLTARRRDLFSERLWQRDRSPLDYRFWGELAAVWPRDVSHVASSFGGNSATGASGAPSAALVGPILLALMVLVGGRVLLDRWGTRQAAPVAGPTRLARSLLALWSVAGAVITALIACLILRVGFNSLFPRASMTDALLTVFNRVVVFASLVAALGRAVLQPDRPDWRPAPLPDPLAARIRRYPDALGLAFGTTAFVVGAAAIIGVDAAVSAALQCIASVVQLVAIAATLLTAARTANGSLPDHLTQDVARGGSRLPWGIALLASWVALTAALCATALGYIPLGAFILREMIWIATLLAILFLLASLVDEALPALVDPSGRVGTFLATSLGLSAATLRQSGVLLSGLGRLALLLFGWTAIWAPFGTTANDLFGRLSASDLILHFGQVTISPGTILIGVLLLLAGIAVTRAVRRWLESRYLPTTSMDMGAQNALAVGITYLGAIFAIVIASTYLGLSLDKIALLASALSVGIGFGLQSIIANFVSGLILLVERPIKVGDWIALGDLEGDVRRISVRATEIEMRDRSKLIVPNTDLVSKTIRNVTRGSSLSRIKIVLRVADTTDPHQVRDLFMAGVEDHAEILRDPATTIFLSDVRDGALEFTILAYVDSAREAYRIKSELLFRIVPDLRTAGIAFASSTPVVNLGLADRAIEPGATVK